MINNDNNTKAIDINKAIISMQMVYSVLLLCNENVL